MVAVVFGVVWVVLAVNVMVGVVVVELVLSDVVVAMVDVVGLVSVV